MCLLRNGCQNEITPELYYISRYQRRGANERRTIDSCRSVALTAASGLLAVWRGSNAAGRRTAMAFSSSALLLATKSNSRPVWNAIRARWTPAQWLCRVVGRIRETKRATSSVLSISVIRRERCRGVAVALYACRNRRGERSLGKLFSKANRAQGGRSTYLIFKMDTILMKCGVSWYGRNRDTIASTLNSCILRYNVSRLA